jgi:hypothetical protein
LIMANEYLVTELRELQTSSDNRAARSTQS